MTMNTLPTKSLLLAALLGFAMTTTARAAAGAVSPPSRVTWKQCLSQPPAWYGSDEAVRIADNVLLYQRDSGGWPKNIEMAAVLTADEKAALGRDKSQTDSTLDNGATHRQLVFLARVFNAAGQERFKDAFLKGLDYLFAAQYENGGWPQVYPRPPGYSSHITFNDGAMIGALTLLREIARKNAAYAFVGEPRRARAEKAVQKGIDCILNCQIAVSGKRTAWCAQHDEKTLAPAPARSYEKSSISGAESVDVVRFLMDVERPDPRVVEAVESAAAWFEAVKITGIRQVRKPDPSQPRGSDKVIVADPAAPPLWARFYEIGTNRPIFCGRDGVIKYSLAEIEYERRNGYSWYTEGPADLLKTDYPAWRKKQTVAKTVSVFGALNFGVRRLDAAFPGTA